MRPLHDTRPNVALEALLEAQRKHEAWMANIAADAPPHRVAALQAVALRRWDKLRPSLEKQAAATAAIEADVVRRYTDPVAAAAATIVVTRPRADAEAFERKAAHDEALTAMSNAVTLDAMARLKVLFAYTECPRGTSPVSESDEE